MKDRENSCLVIEIRTTVASGEWDADRKRVPGNFLGHGNVLYLDLHGGYIGWYLKICSALLCVKYTSIKKECEV